ncbi:MAG: hypothetical protein ACTSV6_02225 [Candidatus Heimdallarchaeota archaeon]
MSSMTTVDEVAKTPESTETIFDGILFSFNDETGPVLSVNYSPLNERQAIATIIQGITAVGMTPEVERELFGPIPVPYNQEYRALMYVFRVESSAFIEGRFCSLFLIFKKEMIRFIANVYAMIKSLLNVYHDTYLINDTSLREETVVEIYRNLIANLKFKHHIRTFRINNGITIEFEEQTIMFGNELTVLVDEKAKMIYTYAPRNLPKETRAKALKTIQTLNKYEYQNRFTIKTLSSKKAFVDLLKRNKIQIVG